MFWTFTDSLCIPMLVALYIFFILLTFINKKSKSLSVVLWGFAILLMGLNTENPDSIGYMYEYEAAGYGMIYKLEIGHYFLMRVCNLLSLTFIQYKIIVSTIIYYLFAASFRKLTPYIALVAGFYLLCYLPQDVIQYRNCMSFSIVLYGFAKYKYQNTKHSFLKMLICILLATTIHISSAFYLIFLFPKRFFNKVTFIILLCISYILSLSFFAFFSSHIGDTLKNLSGYENNVSMIAVIFYVSIQVFICLLIHNLNKIKQYTKYVHTNWCFFIEMSNWLLLLITPMYLYDMNFIRLFRFWCIPTFIYLINYKSNSNILKLSILGICIFLLWIMMYESFKRIYEPVFYNNLVLG